MKKLLTILILSALYAPIHCMEEDAIYSPAHSSKKIAAPAEGIPSLNQLCASLIVKNNLLPKNLNELLEKLPLECVQSIIKQRIIQTGIIDSKPIERLDCYTDFASSISKIETENEAYTISTNDQTIHIWDMNGKEHAQCNGHTGLINSIFVINIHDELLIISGSSDGTIRMWDINGEELAQWNGYTTLINSVCTIETKTGLRPISSSLDNTIRIWDINAQYNGNADWTDDICAVETKNKVFIFYYDKNSQFRIWNALDILKKLDTITLAQATAIYKALDTITNKMSLGKAIKRILNNPEAESFFSATTITTPGVLSATVENLMQKHNKK